MNTQIFIFLFTFTLSFAACKHISKLDRSIKYGNKVITAGEEDSTGMYKILIADYGRFIYTVDSTVGGAVNHYSYTGICRYSSDTIFLKYATKEYPMGLQKYLIVEASKSYLIQYLVNKPQRVFLRINKPIVGF